jgi:protein-tyrosine phosphatase
LEGAYNARELGGFPINRNSMTKWGIFLRSDDLAAITQNDMNLLYDYGTRTVINLKAVRETENPIEYDKRFNYIQMPVIADFPKLFEDIKNYGGGFYLTILETCKENIKEVFNSISEHIGNGGILFHCLSGKDRTGIIAALLLLISGVSELDALADYIVSAIYMRPDAIKRNQPFDSIIKYPEEIEYIFKILKDNYNGAENYLKHIGVSTENINKIKDNFIVETEK